jgi:hypothetical protein
MRDFCLITKAQLLLPKGRFAGSAVYPTAWQDAIMKIIGKFGSTEGIRFDHYVMAWDFG